MEINSNIGSIRDMALKRASAKEEARNNERVSNRKEINRNSSEVAFLNQTNRTTKAAAATKAGLSTALGAFNSATDAVDTIKSNLQEIRGIIDAGLKGTLANTNAGQDRINELVTEIKSLTENTKYGDQKIFGGSFSYKASLNSNNTYYAKNLSNLGTGTVAPPIASGTTTTVSEVKNINENSQEFTDGYTWSNTTLAGTAFTSGDEYLRTSLAVNNQYIVKSEEELFNTGIYVYDKNTGALIRSYAPDTGTTSAMALNNNNKLVIAQHNGLVLDDLDTASQENIQLRDSSNNILTGLTGLDISDNYIVATKAAASGNGGTAYVFDANTGALLDEITDTSDYEPSSKFGSAVAVDGNTLVVGAQYTSAAADAAGKKGGYAKVYDLSSGNAVEQSKIVLQSSVFGQPGVASKLDFQGSTLIMNNGNQSLIYDVNNLTYENIAGVDVARQKGSFSQGGQVNGYRIEAGKVAVYGTNNTVKLYDIADRSEISSFITDGTNHTGSVAGIDAIVFDGTSIFSQDASNPNSNIKKSTLNTVSNNILDSDAMGKLVASTDNYIISLAPGRDNNGVRNSGSLFVYDKLSGNLVKEFKDIADLSATGAHTYENNFALAASGNKIAVLDKNGDRGMVFDIGTSAVDTFAAATFDTIAIDGDNIAVGSIFDNTVSVFKQDSATGAVDYVRDFDRGSSGGVSFGDSIDISGNTLVVADSGRGQIETFDLTTGNSLAAITLTGRSSSLKSQVSISGDKIAVSNINNAGAVGLYNLNLVNQRTFTGGASAVANKFGESIDLNGDYLAIGASNEQNPAAGAGKGSVSLYDVSTGSKISTIFSSVDLSSDTSEFGSSVSISGSRLVVGAPKGGSAPGEDGGNISLFDISLGGSYTDYPFARPKSLIQSSKGLEIDVASNKKGSFATGTNNALQDISVSSTVASLGGKRDLANFKDLYDIDQMIANLGSISAVIKDETKMLNRYATANQGYYDYNKRQFDRLNANKISVQANSNPTQVANLLP